MSAHDGDMFTYWPTGHDPSSQRKRNQTQGDSKLTVRTHSATAEMDALLASARRRHPELLFLPLGDDDE